MVKMSAMKKRLNKVGTATVFRLTTIALGGCFQDDGAAQEPLRPGTEIELTQCAGFLLEGSGGNAAEVNTIYLWVSGLPTYPAGGHFRFHAQFPRSRYISYQNYSDFNTYGGANVDVLADTEIVPDAGSVNPFQAYVPYLDGKVSYTVDLLDIRLEDRPLPEPANILYGGYLRDGTPIDTNNVRYRVYVPDPGTNELGGVPLPKLFFVVDNPTQTSLEAIRKMCKKIHRAQRSLQATYSKTANVIGALSDKVAALRPPLSLDVGTVNYLANAVDPSDSGGHYMNAQSGYLYMQFDPLRGPVMAVRFKAPTFPDTERGEEITEAEQVRYWSVCMQQTSVFLNTTGCLRDAQIEIDDDGYVRLAFSYPEDRPVVDGEPYGNWLAMTDIFAAVLLRHMQPNPEFSEALLFYTGDPAARSAIAAHMGEYFPVAVSCTKAEFEINRCGL